MSATNVVIPVNDLSTGVSWNGGCPGLDGCSSIANQSYQDVVTVTGVTSSGSTVVATSQGRSGIQSQNATTPALAGNLSSGMYLPVANALASATSSGTSYGGP